MPTEVSGGFFHLRSAVLFGALKAMLSYFVAVKTSLNSLSQDLEVDFIRFCNICNGRRLKRERIVPRERERERER